uniref:Uncharacterized protein n=1 Tax=Globisporangium ultimum (strain ATCC 200006 / CBS 805.95 / DAOM BR144) TaxID=431595 RepID=K3W598_GLOUD
VWYALLNLTDALCEKSGSNKFCKLQLILNSGQSVAFSKPGHVGFKRHKLIFSLDTIAREIEADVQVMHLGMPLGSAFEDQVA